MTPTAQAGAVASHGGGNPSCTALGYDFGAKVENPTAGGSPFVVNRDGVHVSYTVATHRDTSHPNSNNAVTSFTLHDDSVVRSGAVIVKAANGATVYAFDAGGFPWHAPKNASHKWPTLSHVDVCWDAPPPPAPGQLMVTKDVVSPEPETASFEICIVPDDQQARTVQEWPRCVDLVDGASHTFSGLRPGDYRVYENGAPDGYVVTVAPQDVVPVVSGARTDVTVTNTWGEGRLDLTKEITGDGADMGAVFEVCVQRLTPTVGPEICDIELGDGESGSLALPPGTYRVYEPGLTGGWTAVVMPSTVTVVAGQVSTATITNTWTDQSGSLRVFKNVVRVGYTPTPFTICIEPVLAARTLQQWPICVDIIGNGESHTFLGLAPGEYRVFEDPVVAGYDVVVTPASVVEVTAGARTDVTVTNTWREIPPPPPPPPPPPTTGAVQLTKVVEGTPAEGEDIDGTFELCLTGPSPATTEICRTVETIDGIGSAVITGLTPGTYTVTETDPGDGFVVDVGDGTVTVVAGGLDTAIVTNTILTEDEEPVIPPVTPPDDDEDSDSGGPVPTPPTGALPHTGIELTLALIATATLGAGALLLTVARRRPIR